ncbi:MAG TPA: hypothetical protein VN132_16310, partial [Bdellovibrio sp.]|nr:hypothetical protein [Bdellovibrio sp.]
MKVFLFLIAMVSTSYSFADECSKAVFQTENPQALQSYMKENPKLYRYGIVLGTKSNVTIHNDDSGNTFNVNMLVLKTNWGKAIILEHVGSTKIANINKPYVAIGFDCLNFLGYKPGSSIASQLNKEAMNLGISYQ